MTNYIASIDQGTTSTRCIVFDHDGTIKGVSQMEHEQIFPKAGWVEHDPQEIWDNTRKVCAEVLAQLDLKASDIAAVGITNQRETTLHRARRRPGCGPVQGDHRTAAGDLLRRPEGALDPGQRRGCAGGGRGR